MAISNHARSEGWDGEPIIRAYDKKTGAVVAEVESRAKWTACR